MLYSKNDDLVCVFVDSAQRHLARTYRVKPPGGLRVDRCQRVALLQSGNKDLAGLAKLRRQGWKIGIVTNGMTDNQLGKIRNTGLDRHVDAWCISHEAGIRKPDPRIFQLAAHRCGLAIDGGGWMIGDSLTLDIAGGAAAGLRTVWIPEPRLARQHAIYGPGFFPAPAPDATVTSVAEAVEVLLAAK